MGAERKALRKKKIGVTPWFVVFLGLLFFFPWVSWCPGFCELLGQGNTRQVAWVASCQERQQGVSRAWHPVWADKQGEPSKEPPEMGHSLQQDLQDRHLGFALQSRLSLCRALPASCLAVWLSIGAGLVMVKEPRHQNGLAMIIQGKKKEVHSFEPWRTLWVLQPSKTAQARLADLHVSHNPKLSEPRVCSGNKLCFLNCSHSRI